MDLGLLGLKCPHPHNLVLRTGSRESSRLGNGHISIHLSVLVGLCHILGSVLGID